MIRCRPIATKGSRGSSLKTNSKVREVREKSVIDSPRDNEHDSSLSRSHEKTPQQEERKVEREEEIEKRKRERRKREKRKKERREKARRERKRENRKRKIERESRKREIEKESRKREKKERRKRERNEESEGEEDDFCSLPPQFEEMSNQLQVYNWLVAHPEILNLTNKMLTAKSQDTGILSTTSQSQPDNSQTIQKRSRKTNYDASKKFTDYRNKYNKAIILLVKDMCEIEREIPTNISDHEVNEFISENIVIKKLLRQQLAIVNTNELKKISSLKKLIEFTCKSFKIH
ncbi:hypothetical protein C1646_796588 [Rhizophagus diaphanus]|nr:hypothetical protein C1646_796588 [Rhizophagus diaphanus] [Rhizophagus sp. MUCL 43196]